MLNNVAEWSNSSVIIYKLTTPVTYYTKGVTFLCLLTGAATITIDGQTYSMADKDIVLLHPGATYNLESELSALIMELTIDYFSFRSAFPSSYDFIQCNSMQNKNIDHNTLLSYIARLAVFHYNDLEQNRFFLLSNIYQFFHYLDNDFLPNITDEKDKDKFQIRKDYIIEYIKKNYAQPITLNELAVNMDITPQYLAKFIKQNMDSTFIKLLNSTRIDEALNYVKYTEIEDVDIAQQCGFPATKIFINKFIEKFHTEPSAFRDAYKKSLQNIDSKEDAIIEEPSLARDFIVNNVNFSSYTSSAAENAEKSNISITLPQDQKKHKKNIWMDMINIGYSINFKNPSFREHIQLLQSELNFKYGRVQGIMDLINAYESQDSISYNLIEVFSIIDFLISVNIRPMLELGSKSITIYKDESGGLTQQKDVKESYSRLKNLLPVFLENCINRYGINEVSQWKFELWMQYNTTMSKVEPPSEYVKRFKFFRETIKSVMPTAEVGGPGFNTFMNFQHLIDVVKELNLKNAHPDFISYYLYPYKNNPGTTNSQGEYYILSKDKNMYKKYSQRVKSIVNQYLSDDTKLYVTEYSSFVNSHNYINDSSYAAAFIIKEAMDNWEYVDMFGYWLVSDISIEFEDAPEILFGGNGLITRSGIKKPSYYAYYFLNQLGNRLIAKGENYIVTTDNNRNFQILVFHYGYFNEQYCENQSTYKLLRYPSSAFEDLPSLDLSFNLKGIPSGTYTIRKHAINQNQGSILYNWLKMDTLSELAKKDIEYLKNISIPNISITKKDISGSLELTCQLKLNNIVFYEINPWLS